MRGIAARSAAKLRPSRQYRTRKKNKTEYIRHVLPHRPSRPALMSFAELCATSNFTFLTGAAHPEEYMERAAELGLSGVAIADVNSVAGVVRAHARAREIARQVTERQKT